MTRIDGVEAGWSGEHLGRRYSVVGTLARASWARAPRDKRIWRWSVEGGAEGRGCNSKREAEGAAWSWIRRNRLDTT